MKKFLSLTLAAVMSLSAFAALAGCGGKSKDKDDGKDDDPPKTDGENTAPVITGVKEEAMVFAGEEYDALAGVTASDAEDGDLTSKIEVSASGLTFANGKVTPTEADEYTGYEIVYTVTDSDGEETEEYSTLYVYEESEALVNVFTADFSAAPTVPQDDADARHYWEPGTSNGGEADLSFKKGALVVDVTNGGANAGDVLLKRGFGDYDAAKYRVVAWVDSSAATSIKAKASVSSYSEEKDVTLTAGYQKITAEFNVTAAGQVWFEFHLGGEGKEGFSLSFIKIDIYKVIGTGADTTLFENTFTTSSDGITPNDKATVSFNNNETHVAVQYNGNPSDDGYSRATIAIADQAITKGTQYKLSLTLKATNALQLNVCVEDNQKEWQQRAFFEKVTAAAGEEKTVNLTLDWHDTGWQTVESGNAVIRLYFGLHDASQNNGTNDVIIKNVKLIQPGQTDRKAHDNFLLFGGASVNKTEKKYPFDIFSGSDDEHNPVAGVATAYVEDGKLVYKVYEGGNKPENHKLVVGFGGNTIDLPEDAYYVVSFTIKATAELDFNLAFHDMTNQGLDNWNEGLFFRYANFENSALHMGTTEKTFTFITHAVNAASQCELIFEFGTDALAALTGGVTIEISELSIGHRKIKTAAAD